MDNLCFYKMEGKYYVRMRSSLTSKRVKTDPAFAVTMRYADLLGRAAKIASNVYRLLPKALKAKGLYRKLTGEAMQWLKKGHDPEQVLILLRAAFEPKTIVKEEKETKFDHLIQHDEFANAVIASISTPSFDDDYVILSDRYYHAPP